MLEPIRFFPFAVLEAFPFFASQQPALLESTAIIRKFTIDNSEEVGCDRKSKHSTIL